MSGKEREMAASDPEEVLRLANKALALLHLAASGAQCRSQRSDNPAHWECFADYLRNCRNTLEHATESFCRHQEGERDGC
tara:strand:- start:1240 stop:1479 length:240 start_codon:yes stop_codon:yes gene_type:complete